jgi:Leucine-rich repeat (LRR) protein
LTRSRGADVEELCPVRAWAYKKPMSLDEAHRKIVEAAESEACELNLRSMNLTRLPAELFQLTCLKLLNVEKNNLTALPPEIGALSNLEELHVNSNRLSALPPEISGLTRLRVLSLHDNWLTKLPPEIGKLSGLKFLWLQNNKLFYLPPDCIVNLIGLESLDVGSNRLAELPRQIGRLAGLKRLRLHNNQLTALPAEIGGLVNLEYLSLENNRLTGLPSDVGQLRSLTELNVQDNQLEAIPSELGNLSGLRSLQLQNNRLSRLPSEICRLRSLNLLDLKNNQLTALPPHMGELASLEFLLLQNNQLTSLPEDLSRLHMLKFVGLHDNQPFPLPITTRVKDWWDVFISHASEDKEAVAFPLARALTAAGLRVWIDKQEIRLGDSIREKIDAGLSKSRYGVVILSQSFLDKVWTKRELNGLMAVEGEGEKVILPVWHNISKATLARYSPLLSDRAAADTQAGIPAIASQIIDVVLYQANDSPSVLFPSLTRRFVQFIRDADSASDIRDFLIQHGRILAEALGKRGWSLLPRPELFGGRMPALSAELVNRSTFKVAWKAYLVFASPDMRLLRPENTSSDLSGHDWLPVLESVRTQMLAEDDEWDEGVIVAGRRLELNETDKERIEGFNQANSNLPRSHSAERVKLLLTDATIRRGSGTARTLKVRTYDWLVDACVLLEQR